MDVMQAVTLLGQDQIGYPTREELLAQLEATVVVERWLEERRTNVLAGCRRYRWGGYYSHAPGQVSVEEVAELLGVSRSKAGRLMQSAVRSGAE